MKRYLLAAAIFAVAASASAADIDVSISAGHPNYFGKIEIDQVAKPAVVFDNAVIVRGKRRVDGAEPIYMRLPEKQVRQWSKYCSRYDACGTPVYFVKDEWYRNVYVVSHHGEQKEASR